MREDEKKGAPAETETTALTVGTKALTVGTKSLVVGSKALTVGTKALTVGTKALTLGGLVELDNYWAIKRGEMQVVFNPAIILTANGNSSTSWITINNAKTGIDITSFAGLLELIAYVTSGVGNIFLEVRPYNKPYIHGTVYASNYIIAGVNYPYCMYFDRDDDRFQYRVTVIGSLAWAVRIRLMGGVMELKDHKHNITPDPHDHGITPDPHDHGITPDPHDHGITPDPHDHGITPDPHDHTITPDPHKHDI